jgi:alginate O-acetyltransferase complex protein AlgI
MNFIQPNFLIFLFIFSCLYSLFGQRARISIGIIGSFYFYAYFSPQYAVLLLISSLVDFFCGRSIYRNKSNKRLWLILSLCCNLGILLYFKYDDFIIDNLAYLFPDIPKSKSTLVPMGISFFTFQTMSYTIDIYRGQLIPSRSFKEFLFYVSFFPQLVAGPIVRAKDFLPQIKNASIDRTVFSSSCIRFLRGFAKKACLADSLGIYIVDPAYNNINNSSPEFVLLAVIAYGLQLYLDFSGYSDMAIAIGRILGFKFPENFNYPYLATSFSEFWKRWHISLSSWLKDYLYISLGGNRYSIFRTHSNLMATMLLGGLWHGAGWNFIIWGALNGFYLIIEHFLNLKNNLSNRFMRTIGHCWVIGGFFFSLIFFRATTFNEACTIIQKCLSISYTTIMFHLTHLNRIENWQIALLLCLCCGTHLVKAFSKISLTFNKSPLTFKILYYTLLGFWLLHFYPSGKVTAFIYFQF